MILGTRTGGRDLSRGLPGLVTLALVVGCPTAQTDPEPADDRVSWGTLELPASECVGDADGVLEPAELVVVPGLAPVAAFLVDVPFASVTLPGSRWELDFPAEGDDEVHFLGPRELDGDWFGASFPEGQFSALTDVGGQTRSVYRRDGDSLLLLGIASAGEGTTVLSYEPEVPVLPLPLEVGDSWMVEAAAEGTHEGQDYPADLGAGGVLSLVHRYEFEVQATGTVALPAADLPALLLRLRLTTEARNSYLGLVGSESVRVDLLVAECLGVVARVRSHPDELDPDFVDAAEVMRLGFEPELLP